MVPGSQAFSVSLALTAPIRVLVNRAAILSFFSAREIICCVLGAVIAMLNVGFLACAICVKPV